MCQLNSLGQNKVVVGEEPVSWFECCYFLENCCVYYLVITYQVYFLSFLALKVHVLLYFLQDDLANLARNHEAAYKNEAPKFSLFDQDPGNTPDHMKMPGTLNTKDTMLTFLITLTHSAVSSIVIII